MAAARAAREFEEELLDNPSESERIVQAQMRQIQDLQRLVDAFRDDAARPAPLTTKEPKANDIAKFNGNVEKLDQFIADLDTLFALQLDWHASDITKTYVAMSCLDGTPRSWALPIQQGYRPELKNNWPAFLAELKTQFQDPNLIDTLVSKIRRLKQGKHLVITYAQSFEALAYRVNVAASEWGNTFYEGLNDEIKDNLALVLTLRKSDYTSCKQLAISID
jgi:hypothetical protein